VCGGSRAVGDDRRAGNLGLIEHVWFEPKLFTTDNTDATDFHFSLGNHIEPSAVRRLTNSAQYRPTSPHAPSAISVVSVVVSEKVGARERQRGANGGPALAVLAWPTLLVTQH